MESLLLVGVDDTDGPGTPGTGRNTRALADALGAVGLKPAGVTRHQLLVHPDVPYTSHNSSACIGLQASRPVAEARREQCVQEVFERSERFLVEIAAAESDVGLCVAWAEDLPEAATAFGKLAQREVVDAAAARNLASDFGIVLKGLTGARIGVIGALAAVGLRRSGNDGRFVDVGAVRGLDGVVRVRDIREAGVPRVVELDGVALADGERVETLGWIRPDLIGGTPVLRVETRGVGECPWEPVGADKARRRREQDARTT